MSLFCQATSCSSARERPDDVKVRDWEKPLAFVLGQPSARGRGLVLRAMSIPDEFKAMCAWGRRALAAGEVGAERRGAGALHRADHLQLVEARMAAVGLAPCGTVLAEDVL